jgi:hypothetical protein
MDEPVGDRCGERIDIYRDLPTAGAVARTPDTDGSYVLRWVQISIDLFVELRQPSRGGSYADCAAGWGWDWAARWGEGCPPLPVPPRALREPRPCARGGIWKAQERMLRSNEVGL